MTPRQRAVCLSGLLLPVLWLAACTSPRLAPAQFEDFDSANTHTRSFAASDARTCEAARRALLSQGYVIGAAGADTVQGKKSYQPQPEMHVEVDFRIVCAREGAQGRSTLAFVSALQDRYALRKTNSAASLGVGALGSVSLPFSGSDDSLVKVASETITSPQFYDRFFGLVERYLAGQPVSEEAALAASTLPAARAASAALPVPVHAAQSPAASAIPVPMATPAPSVVVVPIAPVPAASDAAATPAASDPPAAAAPAASGAASAASGG